MADTFPLVFVVDDGGDRWITPVVSGHRFWQINIKNCSAGNFGALSQVKMATTAGAPATWVGGVTQVFDLS